MDCDILIRLAKATTSWNIVQHDFVVFIWVCGAQ